jgi:hypothetical protein
MDVLVPIVAAIALGAWLVAAAHAFMLLRHVAPPRTAWSLAFQGWRFYVRETFLESGHALHRRFQIAIGTFAACIVAIAVITLILGAAG